MAKSKQKATTTGARKTVRGGVKARKSSVVMSASDRQQRVSEAAYYLAEKHGFTPGTELGDWLEAERQVDIASHSGS